MSATAIAGIIGILGDLALCWLSWRYFIRPRLTRFVDGRIEQRMLHAQWPLQPPPNPGARRFG